MIVLFNFIGLISILQQQNFREAKLSFSLVNRVRARRRVAFVLSFLICLGNW